MAVEELRELRELLDRKSGRRTPSAEPPDEAGIARCLQIMLSRQCIYPGMHNIGPSHRIMRDPDNQPFFRKYFAALGYEFHHDLRTDMIALKVPGTASRFDWQSARLAKDETAVLAALSVAYEEGHKARQVDENGRFDTSTNDIFDKLAAIGGLEIRDETRMLEILKKLARKGVVEIGEHDPVDRVRPVTILQGIEIVLPEAYRERLADWCNGKAADRPTLPSPVPPESAADGSQNAESA